MRFDTKLMKENSDRTKKAIRLMTDGFFYSKQFSMMRIA